MPNKTIVARIGLMVLGICLLMRGWDAVVAVAATILAAAVPLLAGMVIAYIVNILMRFLERHLLPNSTSTVVANLRTPLCMVVSYLLIVACMGAAGSLLAPALVESFEMIGKRAMEVISWLRDYEPARPLISGIDGLFSGDVLKYLSNAKVEGFLKQGLGGTMGSITDQLVLVATSVSAIFFGALFSAWLLLDKHRVAHQVRHMLASYLGNERYARVVHVCEVFDRSYHGYIVRQCAEAAMLGIVSVAILLALGFRYALGISALVLFAALIPVVGVPIGICAGSFLVIADTPVHGIVYLAAMFASQSLVETFVMPHVGDSRILLSPVWVTVAVTLGGGICGFLGMIAATPLAATVYQLIQEDLERRDGVAVAADTDGSGRDGAG